MALTVDFHINCHQGGYFSSEINPSIMIFPYSQGVEIEQITLVNRMSNLSPSSLTCIADSQREKRGRCRLE